MIEINLRNSRFKLTPSQKLIVIQFYYTIISETIRKSFFNNLNIIKQKLFFNYQKRNQQTPNKTKKIDLFCQNKNSEEFSKNLSNEKILIFESKKILQCI